MPNAYEIIVLLQTVLYCCMLLLLTVPERMVALPFTTTPLRYSSLCSKKVFHTLLEEFIRFLFGFLHVFWIYRVLRIVGKCTSPHLFRYGQFCSILCIF